jgi:tripartite-type tricarboxylate transporter receptor subunit TctC
MRATGRRSSGDAFARTGFLLKCAKYQPLVCPQLDMLGHLDEGGKCGRQATRDACSRLIICARNHVGVIMKLPRRRFLHLAAGVAALPAASQVAWAQAYPTRPVRLIVTFAAGGPNDIIARLMGRWLSERLGQQFVIENRPGAGGTVGTEVVVNASPDGYTLILASPANAINATLYENLSYNFIRSVTPVAGIAIAPSVMEVHPSVPAKSVPEFIAYAKARPGRINMASGGVGSSQHAIGELFKMMAGVDLTHVPYRGEAPALTDLLGGQVQVLFGNLPSSVEYLKAGKLRPLAVTTSMRSEALPEIPTVGDFVPGYEASIWYGIGAPKSTPSDIVDKLNREINLGLVDPKMKARFADLGATVLSRSPVEFGRFIAEETEKWGKVVKSSGMKPE